MEVHAHTHTPRKKFAHYLWEFLMLFLAVFCGFLAENQREHMVEHQREKQYMRSMVEDLGLDTAEIMSFKNDLDSLLLPSLSKSMEYLYVDQFSDSIVRKMYEFVPRCYLFLTISLEDRTTTQLKNSGTLRLIRSKEVTDALASYWKTGDILNNVLLAGYEKTRINVKEISYSLFNCSYYKGNNPFLPLRDNVFPKLVSDDKTQFIKLGNFISNMKNQAAFEIRGKAGKAYEEATQLIKLIKEKYHLE